MGARYVFWREPMGKPYRGNDDRYAPVALLSHIGTLATSTDGKGVSWKSASWLSQCELAIQGAAVIIGPDGRELNESDASAIIWQATTDVIRKQGGGKAIHPRDLIDRATESAASYFMKPRVPYRLITSISLEALPAKRMQVGGCEVQPLVRQSKYRSPEVLQTLGSDSPYAVHLKSSKYLRVIVKTAGRSIHEGMGEALDAAKLLCGLWSLFATYGSWTIRMGKTNQEPIGVIHIGPVHTLHNTDGSPVGDIFWFEPSYPGEMKLFKPREGWVKIDRHRRWAVQQMRRRSYKHDLEHLLIQYAEALGQPDLDIAFLKMWNILERITDTVGAKYDETIERAIWPFPDRQSQKEQLEYLRLRRNQYVHAARSTQAGDQVAYLVKSFVDPHLLALIRNDFAVESLQEYGEFLRLPTDMAALNKRLAHLRRAIRFRKR